MTASKESTGTHDKSAIRRVLASSFIGSAIEYYDFVLYASAATLIFASAFFSDLPPVVGSLVALSTLAVGFVARPLGAFIFSSYGDRVGRKAVLVTTVILMGASTFLIALLPGRDQIGIAAPIILVILRILQGISVGGEWGGAALMSYEHAQPGRRGFAGAFATAGAPAGAALATGALALFTLLPNDQFMAWGWRIPFALSAVLLFVGLWIRLNIAESPMFLEEQERQRNQIGKLRSPLWETLRHPSVLILALISLIGPFLFFVYTGAFGIGVSAKSGLPAGSILWVATVGSIACIVGELFFGWLSDKVGRARVMIGGLIAGGLFCYPFLLLVGTGTVVPTLFAFLVMNFVVLGALFGPLAAFICEQFSTSNRFTGASIGYQLAAMIGGGFGPLVLSALIASGSDGQAWVTLVTGAVAGASVIAQLILAARFVRAKLVESKKSVVVV